MTATSMAQATSPPVLRPLSPYVGVEVAGLDLHAPLDQPTCDLLREAMKRHHLIVLNAPDLSEAEQLALTAIFGTTEIPKFGYDPSKDRSDDEIFFISNRRGDGAVGDGELLFHHDAFYLAVPPRVGLLYALEPPLTRGGTRFRNVRELYRRLPAELVAKASGVVCHHLHNFAGGDYNARQDIALRNARTCEHHYPMVWTDPETGETMIWAVDYTTVGFEGIPLEEGHALIRTILDFGDANPDLEYVHRWKKGDLLAWDNRYLSHAREDFPKSEPRTLRRSSAR